MPHVRTARRLCLAATITSLLCMAVCARASDVLLRHLYAVSESDSDRGTVSIYDIDAGHRLIRTIRAVPNVSSVRGVAASTVTGKLYVAYHTSNASMIYCLDIYKNAVLWNRRVPVGIDRISLNPNGRLIYAPTGEDRNADFIQILDADNGDIISRVYFSNHSHDAQYPLSGPLFQETKGDDGSGKYLYLIDPGTYAMLRVGPFAGTLGPYAVDSLSHYVVGNVARVWGMQVADLKTGRIISAKIPGHPPGHYVGHGIGWTPDQREVWETGGDRDPHVYVWNMNDPMAPVLKQQLTLRSGRPGHWVTFDIRGDYAYIGPNDTSNGTEIFSVATHTSVGMIEASEEMLEVDISNGRISQIGDQFGIGRR